MDAGLWWADIGGVTVWVKADRDGRPTAVDVYGPGDYAGPVEGCAYRLAWSADDDVTPDAHYYLSTACQHGQHGECRHACKFCDAPCRCYHHLSPGGGPRDGGGGDGG